MGVTAVSLLLILGALGWGRLAWQRRRRLNRLIDRPILSEEQLFCGVIAERGVSLEILKKDYSDLCGRLGLPVGLVRLDDSVSSIVGDGVVDGDALLDYERTLGRLYGAESSINFSVLQLLYGLQGVKLG